MKKRIAIIGGGLAGIAAAIRLAEADCVPIVIETSKRLGGRATSFEDSRSGYVLDNCQHVLLGCCTNLIDLYDRLGVVDLIQWHRTLYWTRGRGLIDKMRAGWLPAPLHLAGSMRRMSIFSKEEKSSVRRAMWRMIRLGAKGRFQWRDKTFVDFLIECEQPDSVITDFWNTVIVGACNLDVTRVSAAVAMQVFQDGFLSNRWSYSMGLAGVPLVELYNPAIEVIEAAGGEVLLGVSANAIAFDGDRVTGVVTGDGTIEAAAFVSAVPSDRLDKLVGQTMCTADRRLQSLSKIEVSPILGVHLHFDSQIMDLPHLVLVGRDVHWLFNKGVDGKDRQHIHAVISAADDWMPRVEAEIIRRVIDDIHHVLPGSRGIEPISSRAVKEKRATFAATPEAMQYRPAAAPGYVGIGGGGVENLFLAGDWCDTGWPATMESAVRSGYAAAQAITGKGGVVEDVPAGLLSRMLGLK